MDGLTRQMTVPMENSPNPVRYDPTGPRAASMEPTSVEETIEATTKTVVAQDR